MVSDDLLSLAEWVDGQVADFAVSRAIIVALNKAAMDAMAYEQLIVPLAARLAPAAPDRGNVVSLARRRPATTRSAP